MLLLYTRLFEKKQTHDESSVKQNQSTFNPLLTDWEREMSTNSRQTQSIYKIRYLREVYHLERRFLW